MKNKIVKIRYDMNETGPAEMLSRTLARIVDVPILAEELFQDDVVRLDRPPGSEEGLPEIKEVVYTRYPVRTYLSVHHEGQIYTLDAIFSILGAQCHVIIPPERRRGVMIVGHNEFIDPVGLADAVGITQVNSEELWKDECELMDMEDRRAARASRRNNERECRRGDFGAPSNN